MNRARRTVYAATVAALIAATAALPGSARAADPLVSQGRPATASSQESTSRAPALAVDGSTTTRWASALDAACDCGKDPEWLRVDLGQAYTVSRVVLTWEAAYGTGYRIETSPDAATWTPVFTTTVGDGGTDDLTVSGTGRYVRMYGTARATQWGYSLWEFQVYGTPAVAPTTPPPPGVQQPIASTGGTWSVRFADDFNGGPGVDPAKWRPNWLGSTDTAITKGANAAETACMDPANSTVSGGSLHLALTAGPVSCNNTTKPYRGALVQTWSKGYTFAPGGTANNCAGECYVEVRAKLPATPTAVQNWPGIWTDTTGVWPAGGENDIMEGLCTGNTCPDGTGEVRATYHFPNGSQSGAGPAGQAPFRDNGFHIYGTQWSSDGTTRWYYDGVLIGTKPGTATTTRHFLILDYTAGSWGGPTAAGSTMDVDYAYVWGR